MSIESTGKAANPPLSMRRAKCEGCGCSWTRPCVFDRATGRRLVQTKVGRYLLDGMDFTLDAGPDGNGNSIGCHWNNEYWKQGRAVCSVCVSERKVTE